MRGDRVRERRELLRLSQSELAQRVGTGQKRISAWERGESGATDDMIIGLARAMETSADWLLGLTDDPTPRPNDLSERERRVISAWRQGNREEAARVILISKVGV